MNVIESLARDPRGEISVIPDDFMRDPNHATQDAITATKLLTLGIVSEESVAELLKGAYTMAGEASTAGDSRSYKRAMDVIFAAKKLQLQAQANETEMRRSRMPQIHGHIHYDGANDVRHRLAEINSRLGITGVDQ